MESKRNILHQDQKDNYRIYSDLAKKREKDAHIEKTNLSAKPCEILSLTVIRSDPSG